MKNSIPTTGATGSPSNNGYSSNRNGNNYPTFGWKVDEGNKLVGYVETTKSGVTGGNVSVKTENGRTTIEAKLDFSSSEQSTRTTGKARYGFTTTTATGKTRKFDVLIAENEAGEIGVVLNEVGSKTNLEKLQQDFVTENEAYETAVNALEEEVFVAVK